ncbi:FGGY family carbohydrate kinase, partial [Allofournierella sp.]|uniref:FGGY family carbohydrate kinase n=1 Tax=Allofournierella sp. TaxID=1940256 RepID=UPI002E77610F
MKYFMGVDVGTNETKGVLIDQTCAIVAFASRGHELLNPRPGFFEHDAEGTWWGDFCAVSRQLLQESGVSAADVGCVGLSALGCDCVPVDAEGT